MSRILFFLFHLFIFCLFILRGGSASWDHLSMSTDRRWSCGVYRGESARERECVCVIERECLCVCISVYARRHIFVPPR